MPCGTQAAICLLVAALGIVEAIQTQSSSEAQQIWPLQTGAVELIEAPAAGAVLVQVNRDNVFKRREHQRQLIPTGEAMTSIGLPAWAVAVLACLAGSSVMTFGFVLQKQGASSPGDHWKIGDMVLSPQWLLGFAMIGFAGFPLDLLAYSMAPLSLTTPLSGVTVAMNTALAPRLLGERMQWCPDLPATALIMAGTICNVAAGAHKEREYTPELLLELMSEPRFLVCLCTLVVILLGCMTYMSIRREALEDSARRRPSNPVILEVLLPALVAGGAGCVTNIALKGVGVLLRSGWSFLEILPWAIMTAGSAMVQLNYVSRGLCAYQQTLFIPIYQSMLVFLSTLMGMEFYQEYRQLKGHDAEIIALGVACMISGISAFTFRKPEDGVSIETHTADKDSEPGWFKT